MISIIVPCYNQAHYLDKCLTSISNQTFQEWECILVNDGSTDDTEKICMKWLQDSRFKYFYKTNGGLSSARNLGLLKAKGEYVCFIDSDDTLTNNIALATLTDKIMYRPDVISGLTNCEYKNGRTSPSHLNKQNITTRTLTKADILTALFQKEISVVAWNKLYLKSFLEQHNLTFRDKLIHEDELWALQVFSKAEKVINVARYTYNYFKDNASSITANKNIENYNSLVTISRYLVEVYEQDESIRKVNTALIVSKFKELSTFLQDPNLLKDEKLWITFFSQIQSIYQKSDLVKYKKSFSHSPQFAYRIAKQLRFSTSKTFVSKVKNKLNNILWELSIR